MLCDVCFVVLDWAHDICVILTKVATANSSHFILSQVVLGGWVSFRNRRTTLHIMGARIARKFQGARHGLRRGVGLRKMVRTKKPELSITEYKGVTNRSYLTHINTAKKIIGENLIPLTPQKLQVLVQSMKKRRYRSIKNYLTSVKRFHVSRGHKWDHLLELAHKDGQRAATEGLGNPRRAKPFRWAKLVRARQLGVRFRSRVVLPFHVIMFGSLLLLRSAELNVLWKNVVINVQAQTVLIKIEMSKTDRRAVGFKTRWQCTCQCKSLTALNANSWMTCIFHVCLDYALQVKKNVKPMNVVEGEKPFFQTADGAEIGATDVAEILRGIGTRADLEEDPEEQEEYEHLPLDYSGHSLRRTGVREWFRSGMIIEWLRKLGRWKSGSLLDDYLATLPLLLMSTKSQKMETAIPVPPLGGLMSMATQISSLGEKLVKVETLLQDISKQVQDKAPTLETPAVAESAEILVISLADTKRSKLHKVAILSRDRDSWSTRCGFRFGRSNRSRIIDGPGQDNVLQCAYCFGKN